MMKLIERNGAFICAECGKEFPINGDRERAARDSLFCAQKTPTLSRKVLGNNETGFIPWHLNSSKIILRTP